MKLMAIIHSGAVIKAAADLLEVPDETLAATMAASTVDRITAEGAANVTAALGVIARYLAADARLADYFTADERDVTGETITRAALAYAGAIRGRAARARLAEFRDAVAAGVI